MVIVYHVYRRKSIDFTSKVVNYIIAQNLKVIVVDNAKTATIIKLRCKDKSVTISALLEENSIRKSLIYDMEKRDKTPSAEILEQIADYLDCSVDYLLGRTDKPEVNR